MPLAPHDDRPMARPPAPATNQALEGPTILYLSPLAALIYPLSLTAFNAAVMTFDAGHQPALSVAVAALSLALSFGLSTSTVFSSLHLAQRLAPTPIETRAKYAAFFAVCAPTLFVFVSVLNYMAGNPVPDLAVWLMLWAAVLIYIHSGSSTAVIKGSLSARTALRVAHGISAVTIILLFLCLHITNHLAGLIGPDAHASFMELARRVYRARMIEPILVVLMLFQIGSGLFLAFGHSRAPMDGFRAFQNISGLYLAFYILGHMDSVFVYARWFLRIDSNWAFATGAPVGLIMGSWNVRLIPHYALGIFFLFAHLASGLRLVLMAHGWRKDVADRVMIGCSIAGSVVALLVILAMCGMRIRFE